MRIVEILATDASLLISYYNQIKVYKATTENGTYSSTGTVNLVGSQGVYIYVDNDGLSTDYYKFSYYKSTATIAESELIALPGYYARVTDLKNRINETANTDDTIFVDCMAAATRQVKNYCRRDFLQKIETRYFEGAGQGKPRSGKWPDVLFTDDLVNATAITLDYSGGVSGSTTTALTLNTHCYRWPQDAPSKGFPYQGLAWIENATFNQVAYYGLNFGAGLYWPRGYRAVAITGTWGWPFDPITNSPIPPDVREAVLELAARIYKGRDNAYSKVIGNSEYGSMQIRDDLFGTDTKALLNPYVKIKI